ncbi:MAG: DUF2285 domain-containing protein [Allopontixanthobacter sediminis]
MAGDSRGLADIRGKFTDNHVIAQHENGAGLHLVVSDAQIRHRILLSRKLPQGAAGYVVPDDAELAVRVAALSEFHLFKQGSATRASHRLLKPSNYKRYKLGMLLSILDLREEVSPGHGTLRHVAKALIYPGRNMGRAIDWKTSSHRRQTQRLVAEAHYMAAKGYRNLLNSSSVERPAN